MKTQIFRLAHDESKFKLLIEPWMEGEYFEGIQVWNECIYISTDRKLLRRKANEIKESWLNKRIAEIEALKTLKINNKY